VSSPEQALSTAHRLNVEHVSGIVEWVTFHSDESGYTVLRFTVPSVHDLIMTIGRFPEMHAGQALRLPSLWHVHRSTVGSFSVSMRRK
jgi:exodeoxyribonuclease V alpha subunit